MHRRRLVGGMTVAFGAMSLLLAIVGVLTNPILLVLSAVFLVVTGLLYYQASGRLAERVYRQVEQQASVDGGRARRRRQAEEAERGGFGAGPREEWTGPHRREGRQRAGQAAGQQGRRGQRRQQARQQGRQRQRRQRPPTATGGQEITAREAYDVLGLNPGADQEAIRSAYRERIKDVHPDTPDGDEEAFRRVRTAYERLSE